MRNVCVVLTHRAHYGRSKYLLEELKKNPDFELQIVVAGAALSDQYGNITRELEDDGYKINYKIFMVIEGNTPLAMAKTTALGLLEFSTAFDNLKPDIVLVRGDRFEVIAPVIAAAYMNITVAHIEGGDLSGSIDESVRHAITQLAHIHFPTNEDAKNRIIQMGEDPEQVFDVGSPDVEFIIRNQDHINTMPDHIFKKGYGQSGIGDPIDLKKDYVVILQHPVTSEYGHGKEQMQNLLTAVEDLNIPAVFFWPNLDAGSDELTKIIRRFINEKLPKNIHFFRHIKAEDYLALINHAKCLVGNSSSGIKEASFLGVPVVNIGTRQNGRLRGQNVIDTDYSTDAIKSAIMKQMRHGRFASSKIYGSGNTSKKIAEILEKIELSNQKSFFEPTK